MSRHRKEPNLNPNEETSVFVPSQVIAQAETAEGESLFETYERRSLRSIIDGQRAYRESQAAQAARVILDDAEIPEFEEFEHSTTEYEDFENATTHAPRVLRIRVENKGKLDALLSPGAQVVYVLLTLAAIGGTLGLALSTDSPHLLLIGGIATPMLLPICVWRWFRWLDSSPYYYRLLTSLGEDARNLMDYRLLGRRRFNT
jgi:hypothetical protein